MNYLVSLWSIRYHLNRYSYFFFDEFYVFTAVFRKFIVFLDTTYITFPSRKNFIYRFCLSKFCCYREVFNNFTINLITYTYRNFLKISETVKYGKYNFRSTLYLTTITCSNGIKSSHTAWTSCCSTILSAVSSAFTKLFCLFFIKNLTYKFTCTYST